jgi:hypothetical protein
MFSSNLGFLMSLQNFDKDRGECFIIAAEIHAKAGFTRKTHGKTLL